MKIALISFDPVWENKEVNLEKCDSIFQTLSSSQLDLCVFPEMTLTGFSFSNLSLAEKLANSKSVAFFQERARLQKLNVVFGMMTQGSTGDVYNSALVIDRQGRLIDVYNKIHLFSPGRENKFLKRGNKVVTLDIDEVGVGLSVCYDLRFPELYTKISEKAGVAINIANWPSVRESHWETLLRARAIENQIFMVGVNRSGLDRESEYAGNSFIFDPWGNRISAKALNVEIACIEIDFKAVEEIRSQFPKFADRRFEVNMNY